MARITKISGAGGAALGVAGIAVPIAWPPISPIVGYVLLGLAGLLALIAFISFILGGRVQPVSGSHNEAKTFGDHSPALVGSFRDVHLYSAPKVPDPQLWRAPETRLQASSRKTPGRMEISENDLRAAEGLPPLQPDTPFVYVIARLHHIYGPKPQGGEDQFERKINLNIADTIHEKGLLVWARIGDLPRQPISAGSMSRARFNYRKKTFSVRGIDAAHPTIYEDVTFNRSQVDKAWPLPKG